MGYFKTLQKYKDKYKDIAFSRCNMSYYNQNTMNMFDRFMPSIAVGSFNDGSNEIEDQKYNGFDIAKCYGHTLINAIYSYIK